MKKEQQKNKVSEKLGKRRGMYIDRFHFKNHIGKECVQKRDPYKIEDLNDVNTQAAEQLSGMSTNIQIVRRCRSPISFSFGFTSLICTI